MDIRAEAGTRNAGARTVFTKGLYPVFRSIGLVPRDTEVPGLSRWRRQAGEAAGK